MPDTSASPNSADHKPVSRYAKVFAHAHPEEPVERLERDLDRTLLFGLGLGVHPREPRHQVDPPQQAEHLHQPRQHAHDDGDRDQRASGGTTTLPTTTTVGISSNPDSMKAHHVEDQPWTAVAEPRQDLGGRTTQHVGVFEALREHREPNVEPDRCQHQQDTGPRASAHAPTLPDVAEAPQVLHHFGVDGHVRTVSSARADLPCLRDREPRRLEVLQRVRRTVRRRGTEQGRGAQGRHGAVLRPGRVHRRLGCRRPEDVQAIIRPYHQLLKHRIEDYGGTVEKFIGDAVMAVFGAPLAHEDDAERAIRAGLRILEAIAEANADDPALDLKVRIGINTGEAVVSLGARPEQGEGFVTGDVVNTASRLQGVAPVNGIAVGEATHEATASIFEFEELEPVELKGKAEPVRLWWAKAARSRFGTDVTRTHDDAARGPGTRTRPAHRDVRARRPRPIRAPRHRGRRARHRQVAARRGALRLFRPFARSRHVATGSVPALRRGVAFWALGEIVKAATRDPRDRPAGTRRREDRPERCRQSTPTRRGCGSGCGRSWDWTPSPPRARRTSPPGDGSWRSSPVDGPLVVVVEDLHWADEALLAFLEEVVEFVTGVSMVVLVTARPELFERAPGFAQSARNSNRVNLAPLSEAETARLAAVLLDSTVLPAEVSSLVVERAGGNPLYAEEFVRLLKDTGLLRRDGVSWVSAPDADEIPLPSGVQGLIAARLDTLEPRSQAVAAGRLGPGQGVLERRTGGDGRRGPAQIDAVLHELGRRELVRRQPVSSMAGETEYAFWHALVRDVCYGQLPRSQRIERHRSAARWIESAAGMRLEDHAEILAGHYTAALELAVATGRAEEADGLAEAARRYLTLAGDRSLSLDVAGAEAAYRSALDLTPEGTPERAHLLAKLAEALLQRARFSEASELLEAAHALFLTVGDVRSAAVALARTSVVLSRIGDSRTRDHTAAALELLAPLPPGPELVQVLSEYAGAAYTSDDLERAIEASQPSDRGRRDAWDAHSGACARLPRWCALPHRPCRHRRPAKGHVDLRRTGPGAGRVRDPEQHRELDRDGRGPPRRARCMA